MAGLVSSVLAGACIVFALPPYSILPLGMVAFAVLSLLLRDAAPMRALGLGYLFGLGQFVPGLFWVTESFQVDADRFGWLALPAVLGLAAVLSVFPALACTLSARMARAGLPLALSLATSWTGLEWLRGHVLTGFPWNLAAYTLADWLPFAQVASLVGSYGLGFLLVLCSALVGLAFPAPARRLQVICFASATAIAVIVAGFGAARLTFPRRATEHRAKRQMGRRIPEGQHPPTSLAFCTTGRLRYPALARNRMAGVSRRRHWGPCHAWVALAEHCRPFGWQS